MRRLLAVGIMLFSAGLLPAPASAQNSCIQVDPNIDNDGYDTVSVVGGGTNVSLAMGAWNACPGVSAR